MELLETIMARKSTRAYLDKPVGRQTLEKLLSFATRAPSAINLQPWEFTVVSGEEKKRLSRLLVKRMKERSISCGPGAEKPLPDYFMDRQRGLLDDMLPYLPKGTPFQDFINEGSCNFYGAPTAIILTIDRAFSKARLADIGIAMGYLVLAAHAMGLGTCPIGIITAFDDEIKEALNLSDDKEVVIGVAVGYSDPDATVNQARTGRAPLNEVIKWRD